MGQDKDVPASPSGSQASPAATDVSAPSVSIPNAGEATCDDCGGHNPVWFAPNDVWNFVVGGPGAKDDPGGFLCPVCFIVKAEAAGLVPNVWELRPRVSQ